MFILNMFEKRKIDISTIVECTGVFKRTSHTAFKKLKK